MSLFLIGAPANAAVVVELFTSQGCSSCPPADALLSALGKDPRLAGKIVPLAFHVDYWNYIGWKDPFSSGEWSERQQRYARRLNPGSVYTPQMVVGGAREMVGSQEGDVRRAVEAALRQASDSRVNLKLSRSGKELSVKISAVLDARASGRADLYLVVFENDITTRVARGENGGRVLRNDYVVRSLQKVASVKPGETTEVPATLRLRPQWNPARIGVAVFAQDPETLRIFAAAATPVS